MGSRRCFFRVTRLQRWADKCKRGCDEWRKAMGPEGRYYPVPHGESVQDVCRQLDEWFNASLDEPRDIREPKA